VFWIKVNFWVQKEILSGKTMKSRGEILAHFIKIAKVSITLDFCFHFLWYFLIA